MPKFRIVVSDPESGTSKAVELEEERVVPLIGRKMGEVLDGTVVGFAGHKVQITGGSDADGFPVRPSVHGGVRRKVILGSGIGFKPKRRGERRRKMVRGNVITDQITQINMKIVEKPKRKGKTGKKKASDKKAEN